MGVPKDSPPREKRQALVATRISDGATVGIDPRTLGGLTTGRRNHVEAIPKARLARQLRACGFRVRRVMELVGRSSSQVYRYLGDGWAHAVERVRPGVPASLVNGVPDGLGGDRGDPTPGPRTSHRGAYVRIAREETPASDYGPNAMPVGFVSPVGAAMPESHAEPE